MLGPSPLGPGPLAGMVTMLSQLTTECLSRPCAVPTGTSMDRPRMGRRSARALPAHVRARPFPGRHPRGSNLVPLRCVSRTVHVHSQRRGGAGQPGGREEHRRGGIRRAGSPPDRRVHAYWCPRDEYLHRCVSTATSMLLQVERGVERLPPPPVAGRVYRGTGTGVPRTGLGRVDAPRKRGGAVSCSAVSATPWPSAPSSAATASASDGGEVFGPLGLWRRRRQPVVEPTGSVGPGRQGRG